MTILCSKQHLELIDQKLASNGQIWSNSTNFYGQFHSNLRYEIRNAEIRNLNEFVRAYLAVNFEIFTVQYLNISLGNPSSWLNVNWTNLVFLWQNLLQRITSWSRLRAVYELGALVKFKLFFLVGPFSFVGPTNYQVRIKIDLL